MLDKVGYVTFTVYAVDKRGERLDKHKSGFVRCSPFEARRIVEVPKEMKALGRALAPDWDYIEVTDAFAGILDNDN